MNSKLIPLAITLVGALCFGGSFLISNSSSGDLDVEIDKTDFIMPAAHRVYANPDALNGKYYLFKAKITNNSDVTLEDVTVKYRIPDYIEWTELTISGEMFPGLTLVIPCYPKFKDGITEKTTESIEKAEIEISWAGLVLIGDTAPIDLESSSNLIFWLTIAAVLLILIAVLIRRKRNA